MIYCLVPRELTSKAGDPDRLVADNDDTVRALIERRSRERRRSGERRAGAHTAILLPERRHVRNRDGRRVGERRALVGHVEAPELSRRGRRYAASLSFVQRLEPPPEHVEDMESARLAARFQSGDDSAFVDIYMRYIDRFHAYLALTSPTTTRDSDGGAAESARTTLQQVFLQCFDELQKFPFGAARVRTWLARGLVQPSLGDGAEGLFAGPGLDVEDDGESDDFDLRALRWLSDEDILVLVRQLPVGQRRVLLLRYLVGLHSSEIAQVTDESLAAVRGLEECATRFLSARLSAIGRRSRQSGRHLMRARKRELYVLQRRRLVLTG